MKFPGVYTDYRDMFEREKLDAVVICTPNKFHAPASIAALDAGLHVLCEKPMALDPVEARAMVAAAERNGKILSIAFHYRHMAPVRAARRVVDSGELGNVYMARVYALRRRGIPSWGTFVQKHIQGGGAMIDFGVHLLDTALWLMGNPQPIEVCASISQHLGKAPNVNPWGQWNYHEFTVEDQAAAFIRFANGASMLLECSWALNIPESHENISLSGTTAGLDVFPLKVNKAHPRHAGQLEAGLDAGRARQPWRCADRRFCRCDPRRAAAGVAGIPGAPGHRDCGRNLSQCGGGRRRAPG